jgi:bifunctional non-homologous end joining protein LigD
LAKKQQLDVQGRSVTVTNLEKALFPAAPFTKAQVIDYYVRAADVLLPHLRDRPVTLKRYPDGVDHEYFYEKDAPRFTPDWVQTVPVPRKNGGTDIRYVLINDLPTLVWTANLASIELHPFLHKAPNIERPTQVVFDLDPGEGADLLTCAAVAFALQEMFEEWKLQCFAKVSGSKGLQLSVPLNTPTDYASTQLFARTVAEIMERQQPQLVTAVMDRSKRAGKIFIDWSQNAQHKTTVAVYSLRGNNPLPYVSMPVEWAELRNAVKTRDSTKLSFAPETALKRLTSVSDLFEPVLRLKQKLTKTLLAKIQG